jgi:hypothetical protein
LHREKISGGEGKHSTKRDLAFKGFRILGIEIRPLMSLSGEEKGQGSEDAEKWQAL